MLTYNDRGLRPQSWQLFRAFVSSLKGRIGARAWAVNFEQSLHAATLGNDASVQPGCLQELMLHETAVSWIRVRLART